MRLKTVQDPLETEDGAAIFRNPKKPGTYLFKALFISEGDDPKLQRRVQEVTISG